MVPERTTILTMIDSTIDSRHNVRVEVSCGQKKKEASIPLMLTCEFSAVIRRLRQSDSNGAQNADEWKDMPKVKLQILIQP
jgi:hypothetical protein